SVDIQAFGRFLAPRGEHLGGRAQWRISILPCHRKPGPTLSDMAVKQESNPIDAEFYQPADAFFTGHRSLALTYDDITLATLYSEILPRDTQLDVQLAEGLNLNIPVISADMD